VCTRVSSVLPAVIGNLLLADYQLIPVLLAIRYDEIGTSSLVILLLLFGLSQSRLRVGKNLSLIVHAECQRWQHVL
jgi:hypothetical protein